MKYPSARRVRLVPWLLVLAGACGECGAKDAGAPEPKPAASSESKPEPVARAATLEGIVRLAEGAKPPEYAPEQMERRLLDHVERGPWPEACTPPRTVDRQPMRSTGDSALSSVVIAVSDFTKPVTRPARVQEVMIRDCRLTPRTIVAMKGDTLRVKSEVDFPFMPSYGKLDALRTLIPGQSYEVPLDQGGVGAVLCGFTAPCGRTDVIVLQHPLASVTDDAGQFRIEGLPSGEPLTISAWHPLLEETTEKVVLSPGETKRIELIVRPVVREIPVVVEEGSAPAEATDRKKSASKPTPKPEPPAAPADGN